MCPTKLKLKQTSFTYRRRDQKGWSYLTCEWLSYLWVLRHSYRAEQKTRDAQIPCCFSLMANSQRERPQFMFPIPQRWFRVWLSAKKKKARLSVDEFHKDPLHENRSTLEAFNNKHQNFASLRNKDFRCSFNICLQASFITHKKEFFKQLKGENIGPLTRLQVNMAASPSVCYRTNVLPNYNWLHQSKCPILLLCNKAIWNMKHLTINPTEHEPKSPPLKTQRLTALKRRDFTPLLFLAGSLCRAASMQGINCLLWYINQMQKPKEMQSNTDHFIEINRNVHLPLTSPEGKYWI